MRSRYVRLRPLAVAVAMLAVPGVATAQVGPSETRPGPRRVDVSGSGGYLLSTDWGDLTLLGSVSGVSGALQQVLARDLVVEPGPVFDAAVTYWEGRYGFRAHVGFAESCLAVGGRCGEAITLEPGARAVDLDAWSYDVGGAIGLVDYRPGAWVWPFFFFGLGAVTYDLERTVGPPLAFIERRPASFEDTIVVFEDPDPLLITVDELSLETRFAVTLGIGTDFRVPLGPGAVGVRLEVSDRLHRSPLDIRVVSLDGFSFVPRDVALNFGFVHNLRAAAGLTLQFGR